MLKKILFTSIITLFLVEICLRLVGFAPGLIQKNKWIKKVETLEVSNVFTADRDGIFKVNLNLLDSITCINGNQGSLLYEDHRKTVNNSFNRYITKLGSKSKKTDYEKALLNYNETPINQEGFYSIPLKKFPNEKKRKVLLLGDSFTWGHSTVNKTNSFANELLAKGHIIYNTGMSGVDVAQYEAIAKKYVPSLKPDLVILNFFMGNDIQYYKRTLKPYHPVYYDTNAGNIMAFQNGVEFYTAEKAYKNALEQMYLSPINFAQKIVVKSALLTQLWKVWANVGFTSFSTSVKIGNVLEKPACNQEIENIIKICEENNVRFELVIISDFLYKNIEVQDFPYLLENIDYTMSPVPKKYYNMNDGHFNDKGHYEYAKHLDSLIIYTCD